MATKKKVSKPKAKQATVKKKTSFTNHATHLKPGDAAPAFTSLNQDGKPVSLADFKGKKLVLYFYPEDDTPTCTKQACNLRDNFGVLKKHGFEVVGVSEDSIAKHKKFKTKYQLPFSLIADEDHSVINAYDVWGKKLFMGKIYDGIIRTTFLIDEQGIIRHVINRPKTGDQLNEILGLWNG